ncbi:PrgI family protein [Candidatus Saccharibacteria bacterium]|nr:PrgI family protein [Candidatus Saccharibacteria bacterium]
MAQYKVIQDIESEDKLLGPLSLRQFIYAAITIALGFVAFKLFISSAWFLGIVFVPPALFFGLLAAPLGGQQSSEIWLLAKIRFFIMPRKRIWDQSGIQQLVTITAPKKVEKQLTKGYSQDEVKSRLRTLSATLDTRGWAVKNATNMYAVGQNQSSDRLFEIDTQDIPSISTEPTADMLDPTTSPRAQAMDQMINKSAQEHKQQIEENLKKYSQKLSNQTRVAPPSEQQEQDLLKKIHAQQSQPSEFNSHLKTINPIGDQQTQITKTQSPVHSPVTPTTDPAILNLVENSEGLSVRTIAHEAERLKKRDDDDEVVISLH